MTSDICVPWLHSVAVTNTHIKSAPSLKQELQMIKSCTHNSWVHVFSCTKYH